MNNALEVLGFKDKSIHEITWKDIKQKYRISALMYHPDKNKSLDASTKFLQVQEAYEFLEKIWVFNENENGVEIDIGTTNNEEENEYMNILQSFFKIITKNEKINEILENVLFICEKKSISLLTTLDKNKFKLIYVILNKYRNVFLLTDEFYNELEKIKEIHMNPYKKEVEDLEIITINVTIDDLLDNLVYKYVREEEIYFVPTWHRELIYEYNNVEFMIECVLNENNKIWIDEENDIHQEITYSLLDIFEKSKNNENIEVYYGKKSFTFSPEIIQFKKKQTIGWFQKGIPKMMSDIYNISNKSDVFLHIFLEN
jgi:hypothetical protein